MLILQIAAGVALAPFLLMFVCWLVAWAVRLGPARIVAGLFVAYLLVATLVFGAVQ